MIELRRRFRCSARVLAGIFVSASVLTSLSPRPMLAQATTGSGPRELLGTFRDDYGSAFRITDTLFEHLPRTKYHIVEWHAAERFLIARNDAGNVQDGLLWTRIDWMPFDGMAPYTWGFCLTAYKAASADAARATPAANRETPRTGCGGYPFSRMRPVPADSVVGPVKEPR